MDALTPMRICFVCGEYPPARHGGIGIATQVLARELSHRGHKVRVIGIREEEDGSPDCQSDGGVEIERLPRVHSPKVGWIQGRYRLFRRVSRWARRGEIDLVEVPDYEGWTAGWGRLPVPVVSRLHGSASYYAREMGRPVDKWLFRLERMALRRASYVCSTSRYTAEQTSKLFGLDLGGARILYNPVIVANTAQWQPEGSRVVYTGTLVPKKGVVQLAIAWNQVANACPEAELHFYGKDGRTDSHGSMREHLASVVSGSARERVFLHGHVPSTSVPEILRTARVAVFPSYSEAFALAPLEAMAQGCPTVYSRRASGPELITHGKDGLLIDPDDTGEIARAIISLLTQKELANSIAHAGQARVRESFAASVVVENNERFFRSCISKFRN